MSDQHVDLLQHIVINRSQPAQNQLVGLCASGLPRATSSLRLWMPWKIVLRTRIAPSCGTLNFSELLCSVSTLVAPSNVPFINTCFLRIPNPIKKMKNTQFGKPIFWTLPLNTESMSMTLHRFTMFYACASARLRGLRSIWCSRRLVDLPNII